MERKSEASRMTVNQLIEKAEKKMEMYKKIFKSTKPGFDFEWSGRKIVELRSLIQQIKDLHNN